MFAPKLKVLFLGCASISFSAFAGSAAEEIARTNESIAVLSAQKIELELRSQIASKKVELERLSGGSTITLGSNEQENAPTVKRIEGIDGKLSASLLFANGKQKIVKTGEKIPGGWTVGKIEADTVFLVRRSEKLRLEFGPSPAPPAPSLPAAPGLLPGNGGAPPFVGGR